MRARVLVTVAVTLTTTSVLAAAAVGSTGSSATVKGAIDLTGVVLSCPSETVRFSGAATLLQTQSTTTPSGEQIATYVFNLTGVSAFGQTSNTQYRVVGATAGGFSFSIGTGSAADTSRFVQTWLLLPASGGKPLSFHEVLTVIYNANGELASFVSQGPADCD